MLPIKQFTLGFVAIATAISMSAPAAAQERACPYIRCFLSIQHDASRVVQGAARGSSGSSPRRRAPPEVEEVASAKLQCTRGILRARP